MAWRPDGKCLAVAYESGRLDLFDVESSAPVLTNYVSGNITFMRWTTCANSIPHSKVKETEEYVKNDTWDFLIQFPSLSKAFSYNPSALEEIQPCHKLTAETSPSLLVVGTQSGQLFFFFSGFLAMGRLSLEKLFDCNDSEETCINEVLFSPHSLSTASVIATNSDGQISFSTFSFPILSSCYSELCLLSSKQSILQGTIDYMSDTLKQVKNLQLSKAFKSKPNNSL